MEFWLNEAFLLERIREHFDKLDACKSMNPDGIHPRVLMDLTGVMARPLLIIFERS